MLKIYAQQSDDDSNFVLDGITIGLDDYEDSDDEDDDN